MADGQNMLSGLNNLPVFEGVPDDERRRALMQAGLAMLQPFNPLEGNALTQLGGGIQAGLSSLDTTRAERTANEQTAFDQTLAERGVAADETRAAAAETTAATGAAGQAASQASEEALRDTEIDLKKAEAEWLRRRHSGAPAGSGKITAAQLDQMEVQARMKALAAQDPNRYGVQADGSYNEALAMTDAFQSIYMEKGLFANPSLAVIVSDETEAADIAASVSGLAQDFGEPVSTENLDSTQIPPEALSFLKEGEQTTFQNGQVWTLEGGKPKRVK